MARCSLKFIFETFFVMIHDLKVLQTMKTICLTLDSRKQTWIFTRWMQDIVGQVWANCMHFSHQRKNEVSKVVSVNWGDNSCRKFVVVRVWPHKTTSVGTKAIWAYSRDCHDFSALHSLACFVTLCFVFCTPDIFTGSVPVSTHFFCH